MQVTLLTSINSLSMHFYPTSNIKIKIPEKETKQRKEWSLIQHIVECKHLIASLTVPSQLINNIIDHCVMAKHLVDRLFFSSKSSHCWRAFHGLRLLCIYDNSEAIPERSPQPETMMPKWMENELKRDSHNLFNDYFSRVFFPPFAIASQQQIIKSLYSR